MPKSLPLRRRSLERLFATLAVLFVTVQAGCGGSTKDADGPKTEGKTGTRPTTKKTTNAKKFFGIESAKIKYEYSGIYTGDETFYFTDWGNTVVILEDKVELGNKVNKTIIWFDKQTRLYDHLGKSIGTSRLRTRITEPPAAARLTDSQMASVGYERLADEEVAGKTCTVYDNPKLRVKTWLWKGIEMKIINNAAGEDSGFTREAQSLEENITIPAELLAEPAGYAK